ncbi:hypothetical protein [Sphingomonas sp. G-3-2-10]|uniref:hypothetical protein n=1 Tax=Sphingomonas sp. G-3-2-10 TaxID=2728838 RepID=UPI00146D09EE|nr:hypothetical protein [Sphingomonas sp. G-3-2-10]NML07282.1 hypothetical protein [Sphingomonas sp. G-3-2-10]
MIRFAALAPLLLAADAAAPLTVSGDRIYDAVIDGVPARLRIDPGAPSMPVINPGLAARIGLNGSLIGTRVAIGPIRLSGKSSISTLDLAGSGPFKRRATWFEANWADDVDGAIGPGGMPADVVRFDLRAPQPGERTVSLPLLDMRWAGMGVRVMVGDRPVTIRFSLDRAESLATASAGAVIAANHRGSFDRPAETRIVYLGVQRPVRHLALASPLTIGPLSITGLFVRTGDFGSAASIPDGPQPEPDPDEIVVTGGKKAKKSDLGLVIGRDHLDRCSSILFDKPAKLLTLSCR